MLNPELQKDINIEIEKADNSVKIFLLDKYFRDTMDLIIRVNKLTSEQGENVELETILNILKLTDYQNIYDAIKTECSIENEATVNQVVSDLNNYIFVKLGAVPAPIKVISDDNDSRPLRNIIQDEYGKEVLGPVALNYYEQKRLGAEFTGQEKIFDLENVKPDESLLNKNIPMIEQTHAEMMKNKMSDVYRELPDAEDKIIKREIEAFTNKAKEE